MAKYGVTNVIALRDTTTVRTQRIKKSKLSLISKSMEYKSLENRERILPVGVVSKNDMGALSTEASKFLCSTPEALTPNFARI
mmetsp:Transcript_14385/g.31503  ORF Transcript_14385/g.31503 Transcript_14385/m.31503 type:complete len:83 (+) Transcript_14385:1473-1721(+)